MMMPPAANSAPERLDSGPPAQTESAAEVGAVLGTPFYMSPEQARGERQLGPTTDIYAIACLLYTLRSGERPHERSERSAEAATAKRVLELLADGPPRAIRSIARTTATSIIRSCRSTSTTSRDAMLAAGEIALAGGDVATAGQRFDDAWQLLDRNTPPGHLERATCALGRGQLALQRGLPERARAYLDGARPILETNLHRGARRREQADAIARQLG